MIGPLHRTGRRNSELHIIKQRVCLSNSTFYPYLKGKRCSCNRKGERVILLLIFTTSKHSSLNISALKYLPITKLYHFAFLLTKKGKVVYTTETDSIQFVHIIFPNTHDPSGFCEIIQPPIFFWSSRNYLMKNSHLMAATNSMIWYILLQVPVLENLLTTILRVLMLTKDEDLILKRIFQF